MHNVIRRKSAKYLSTTITVVVAAVTIVAYICSFCNQDRHRIRNVCNEFIDIVLVFLLHLHNYLLN